MYESVVKVLYISVGTGRELLPFTCRLELSSVHHPASDLLLFAASLHNPLTTTCCSFLLCCYWKGLFTNNCRHWFLYLYFFQLLFLTVTSHELSNYHRIGWTLEWSYCLIPVHYNCLFTDHLITGLWWFCSDWDDQDEDFPFHSKCPFQQFKRKNSTVWRPT